MRSTHYDHAPIVEAIIDVHFNARADVSADLSAFYERVREDYPERITLRQLEMGVGTTTNANDVQVTSRSSDIGLRLTKKDKSRIIQIRGSGFSFSHLPPYTSWEPFVSEAKSLWQAILDLRAPERVNRLGVRYINRVEVPGSQIELSDYCTVYPHVPNEITEPMSSMLLQIQIPQPDIEAVATINQTVVEPLKPNTVPFVLDIDVIKTCDLVATSESVWSTLETLRHKKNDLFEAFITDKTRRLIK